MNNVRIYEDFSDGIENISKSSVRTLAKLVCCIDKNNIIVDANDNPMTLKEICKIAKRSYGTTRKAVAELVKTKKLIRITYGNSYIYQINPDIAEIDY